MEDNRSDQAKPLIGGFDHGIGHLAFMSPQQSERLTPHRG